MNGPEPQIAAGNGAGSGYPEIMTIEQVAEYLQLHPQVVYRHVRAGTLPASRIGRTIRFKKSILDAFLEKDAWSAAGRYLAFVERMQNSNGAPPEVHAARNGNATSTAHEVPAPRETTPARRYTAEADYVD